MARLASAGQEFSSHGCVSLLATFPVIVVLDLFLGYLLLVGRYLDLNLAHVQAPVGLALGLALAVYLAAGLALAVQTFALPSIPLRTY